MNADCIKAITIHQPFAHLIVTPQEELPEGAVQKRVENRRWPTNYRGPLLIHAGKSLDWFDEEDWPPTPDRRLTFDDFPQMAFGALVGITTLEACIPVSRLRAPVSLMRFDWVKQHRHAEGPICWVLGDVIRFPAPIPYRGQQGLFDVPERDVPSFHLRRFREGLSADA